MKKAHVCKNGWVIGIGHALTLIFVSHPGTSACAAEDMRKANSIVITKDEYGNLWPFPDDESAELKCQRYPSPYGACRA